MIKSDVEVDELRARVAELEQELDARIAAEQELRAGQARYRRLVEDVRLIAWEYDPAAKQFLYVSPHAEEVMGYPLEAWTEPGFWYAHVHAEDRQQAAMFSREHVARGEDHVFEYRMIRADGGVVWLRDITTVVTRGGKPSTLHGVLIDVTQRKEAEEALRASEQRFRLAADAVQGLIYDFELATGTVYRSTGLLKLVGFLPDEVEPTVQWWRDRMHPDDATAVQAKIDAAIQSENGFGVEYRARHREGHYVQVWDRGVFLRDADGKVARIVGCSFDITKRKKSEAALRQQAEIIEQIHDSVIETDLTGVVIRWNAGAEQIYGYSRDEAIGRHVSFLYRPEDLAVLAEQVIAPLMKHGRHEVEKQVLCKSGELRTVHLSLSLLHDHAGAPYAMIGYSTDITERTRAEQALRQSEERFRAILQNSNAAIFIKDLSGRYVEFNRQAQLWSRLSRAEAIGKTDHELLPKEIADAYVAADQRVLKSGRPMEIEEAVPHADGIHTHLTVKFPLSDSSGQVYAICGISTDINERIRAEESRKQSNDLQRLMLSELDHRVRNNLASLSALVDISMRDKRDVREFASSIHGRVQAMSAVHSLLSRGHWIAVDLRLLIESLTPHDLRKAVTVEGEEVRISPRQVTALGMVVQELMANSLKHGALKQAQGRVHVNWAMKDDANGGDPRCELNWRESGGPPIGAEPTAGQGTQLIRGFVDSELRGDSHMSYPRDGASHRFAIHLDPVS